MTFARALRSILRQDPDIIMVGEIRDHDTGRVAIQAALTGHLVLSTLHTNNAPGRFHAPDRHGDRTVSAGIGAKRRRGPALGSHDLSRIAARRITPRMRPWRTPAGWATCKRVFFKGEGCGQCHDSGYRGRKGIFEILEVTDAVRSHLQTAEDEQTIARFVRQQGWRPLREVGLQLVEAGQSTLEEVLRVTHAESEDRTRAEKSPVKAAKKQEQATVSATVN